MCSATRRRDAGIGWLVEKSGAPVVPAFIDGRNSTLFQLGGLVHPRVRTALLVREMLITTARRSSTSSAGA